MNRIVLLLILMCISVVAAACGSAVSTTTTSSSGSYAIQYGKFAEVWADLKALEDLTKSPPVSHDQFGTLLQKTETDLNAVPQGKLTDQETSTMAELMVVADASKDSYGLWNQTLASPNTSPTLPYNMAYIYGISNATVKSGTQLVPVDPLAYRDVWYFADTTLDAEAPHLAP